MLVGLKRRLYGSASLSGLSQCLERRKRHPCYALAGSVSRASEGWKVGSRVCIYLPQEYPRDFEVGGEPSSLSGSGHTSAVPVMSSLCNTLHRRAFSFCSGVFLPWVRGQALCTVNSSCSPGNAPRSDIRFAQGLYTSFRKTSLYRWVNAFCRMSSETRCTCDRFGPFFPRLSRCVTRSCRRLLKRSPPRLPVLCAVQLLPSLRAVQQNKKCRVRRSLCGVNVLARSPRASADSFLRGLNLICTRLGDSVRVGKLCDAKCQRRHLSEAFLLYMGCTAGRLLKQQVILCSRSVCTGGVNAHVSSVECGS